MAFRITRGRGAPLGSSITAWTNGDGSPDSYAFYESASHDDASADAPSCNTVSVNFAVPARLDADMFVCIFPPLDTSKTKTPAVTRDMIAEFPLYGRTGDVRHVCVAGLSRDCAYAYRIDGTPRLLHDVYGRFAEGRPACLWGKYEGEEEVGSSQEIASFMRSFDTLRGKCKVPLYLSRFAEPPLSSSFDWGHDTHPRLRPEEIIIYEAHVRGLTAACGGDAEHNGTFAAAISRIPHLKSLGVTAVQLLPIGEFNELDVTAMDELEGLSNRTGGARPRRVNFWGYAPVQPASFTPMSRYGETPDSAPADLKAFVKALHAQGMECYLDIVFNHVGNSSCSLHFFGVNDHYFMRSRADASKHSNVSGCGNTLAPNLPAMSELILESLRWWVSQYHIDGFRLDAAGVLARDEREGCIDAMVPPVLSAIAADHLLRDTKLIVEPWDAGEAVGSPNYLNGKFPLGDRFLEWNPDYLRVMRRFVRGDKDSARAFCKLIRGSRSEYHDRSFGPCHSVNYLSCHDGFCLSDSVAYTKRTNVDGHAEETAGSCGVEGPTTNGEVLELRRRQIRNMILALVLSRGVPMLLQGDELCATKHGNNNTYDIDGPANYLSADAACPVSEPAKSTRAFWARALSLRQSRSALLRGTDFYDRPGLHFAWLGSDGEPRRSSKRAHGGEFVAWSVHDGHSCLYAAFNASPSPLTARVPAPPRALGPHTRWRRVCDTAQEAGFVENDSLASASAFLPWSECTGGVVEMEFFSAVILECDGCTNAS